MQDAPLDLRATLIDSAQCFRWKQTPFGFAAAFDGRAVFLAEDFEPTPFLTHYLDCGRDYAQVAREFSAYPAARRSMDMFPGLRVMNQPPWETVISFILSANNNVSRIRALTDALCMRYGNRVDTVAGPLYDFPAPEALAHADEDELRALRVGYRAPYIKRSARMVADGFPLGNLKDMPYERAHSLLLDLPGVGDKVADCILLFGCGHASAFPVDVWVERLLGDWFAMRAKSRAKLKKMSREAFGEHGGLMQQYLFHAARTGAIPILEQQRSR